MPTGYTYYIEEEENPTFEGFFWRCARAFGGVAVDYTQSNSPIVGEHTIPEYKLRWLAEAEERLIQARKLSFKDAQKEVDKQYRDALQYWERTEADRQKKLAKYDRILASVYAWEPPTPTHENVKKFMIEQIEISTEFMRKPSAKPKKWKADEWLAFQIVGAHDDVQRYKDEIEKAKQAARKSNEWLQALKDSVPLPPEFKVANSED